MIQGFECHPAGESAVANNGHVLLVGESFVFGSGGHTQGCGDRRGGVTDAKGIEDAFRHFWEAGNAAVGAIGEESVPAAGEDLVAVGLVTYIPHDLVVRSIENVMEGDGKLYYPEAGAE